MDICVINETPILNQTLRLGLWKAFRDIFKDDDILVYFDGSKRRYNLYVDSERFNGYNYYMLKLKDIFFNKSSSYVIKMENLLAVSVSHIAEGVNVMLWNINCNINHEFDYVYSDIENTMQAIDNIDGYKKEENNMPQKSYYKELFTEQSQAEKDESRHKLIQSMEILLGIMYVKFNDPATIVFWDDGTKTVVKCQEGDTFDPEKGLAMAIVKKHCGNEGYFNRIFKKWCPEEEKSEYETLVSFDNVIEPLKADNSEDNIETKEFTKANDGYNDITWLTRRNYDRR